MMTDGAECRALNRKSATGKAEKSRSFEEKVESFLENADQHSLFLFTIYICWGMVLGLLASITKGCNQPFGFMFIECISLVMGLFGSPLTLPVPGLKLSTFNRIRLFFLSSIFFAATVSYCSSLPFKPEDSRVEEFDYRSADVRSLWMALDLAVGDRVIIMTHHLKRSLPSLEEPFNISNLKGLTALEAVGQLKEVTGCVRVPRRGTCGNARCEESVMFGSKRILILIGSPTEMERL